MKEFIKEYRDCLSGRDDPNYAIMTKIIDAIEADPEMPRHMLISQCRALMTEVSFLEGHLKTKLCA